MNETGCTFTYRTRLHLDGNTSECLDQCAELFSTVERKLLAESASGKQLGSLKNSYLKEYHITARQFNACRISIEGKRSSIKALQPQRISSLSDQLEALEKKRANLIKKDVKRSTIALKDRRFKRLSEKLEKLKRDRKEGKVRLCFGGRKLFKAQYNLEKNGFKNHKEWKAEWDFKRNNEFLFVGSKDETAGNQSCVAIIQEDGTFNLRLRLPPALEMRYGKHLQISSVDFIYGKDVIRAGLDSCEERKRAYSSKDIHYRELGQALTYRFKKDKKGWSVFISTEMKTPERVTKKTFGALGVDINADHLAITEVDRFGNMLNYKTIPLVTYGLSKNQAKALIGNAVSGLVQWSQETKKPLVLEKLDFQKKKGSLKEHGNSKQSRMLSSLSYNFIIETIKSRSFRFGCEVFQVNPAYTSVIGRVKFSKRYGLSIHHAAAFCIARRIYGFSEHPPLSSEFIPDGKGNHVIFSLPARNRGERDWSFWGRFSKKFRAVLAAHFRAIKHRSSDPPRPILATGNSRGLLV